MTPEEKAEEYAERNFSQADMSIQLAAGAGYQAGYKAGASTQRIIEQEVRLKKSEDVTQGEYSRQNSFFMGWYFKRKEIPTYSDAIEWARKKAIDEACKWLEKELQKIAVDEVKENFLENNFNLILKSQVPVWLTNFRKAMEE